MGEKQKRGTDFSFTLSEIKACLADNNRIRVIARFDSDFNPILEILFLYFQNANYSENLACVTTKHAASSTTVFGSGKVAMTYLKNEEEAIERLEKLIGVFSNAFDYLEKNGRPNPEIVEKKNDINALQLYNLLPRTNCGDCEESGCFAFATLLMNGDREIDDCTQMAQREHLTNREELQTLLQPINLDTVVEDNSDLAELLGLKS